ncbi:MAG: hypothetical protein H0U89_02820, partial [Acidimicrobiia bacterium]|nr:hypothetical protein [Acidimicrobiia bacterium]
VAQAPYPEWHYVVVSLREAPVARSFRIREGNIAEEAMVVHGYDS